MIPGAVRTICAGRRPAYPGAGLTKVLYLVLSSVRDTATKKIISGAVRICGPEARVPRPAYPGAGLTRVRYLVLSSVRDAATKKDDFRRGMYHLCGPEARVPGCRFDEGSLPCLVVRSRCGDDTGSATATACLSEESSQGVEAAVRPGPSFSATG